MTTAALKNVRPVGIPSKTDGDINPSLRMFSRIFALLVGGLVLMGALVTSHDAGLTVPDWPTSFGENMFTFPPSKWKGGIFYEHVHRLYASVVGLLTLVLTAWTLKVEKRRWVKVVTVTTLVVVIVQGILGGVTVLFLLPTAVSSAHGTLGQTFFVLSLIIVYSHSQEQRTLSRLSVNIDVRSSLYRYLKFGIILTLLVYSQLIIAAIMRHSGAGLAFIDFPTHAGHWLPNFSAETLGKANQLRSIYHLSAIETFHLFFHALHRFMAYTILAFVYGVTWKMSQGEALPKIILRTAFLLIMLVSLQMMLGIATIASVRSPWVASIHVLGGALLLATSVLLCLRLWTLHNANRTLSTPTKKQ